MSSSVNSHIELLALTGSKNADGLYVELTDSDTNIFLCHGNVAAPTTAGYALGAIYRRTDTGNIYVNQGSATAANFALIGTVGAGGVALANLTAGITPSHVVKYAGKTSAVTDSTGTITVTLTGALATDVAQVTLAAATNAVMVQTAVLTSNTLTVTLSGAGGANTAIYYTVFRAAS